MIADLRPYNAMKDSGVPWLGEVPEHWEVRKLRQVLTRCAERNRPDLPLLSVVRERGVILRDTTGGDENHNYIPDDLSNYKVVRSGQFAMNKMKAWQGSYGVSRYDGIVSPAYFVFELCDVSGSFFNASIRSRAYVPAFTQASDGVRIGQWDLSETRMREISFVAPPLPEQAAIVRFLDHADRRIRRYIRAKQKLIKLLEEQKQAIIHRAVTRGLDPNVRLKPSGVEWLGDVPEHWKVVRLKSLVSRVTSGSRGWSNFAADSGVLFIRIGNLTRASLDLDLESSVRLQLPANVLGEAARTRVQPDDILLSITAFIGSVAVVPSEIEEAYVSQHVACCRPRAGVANSRWVGYVLLSNVGQTHGQLSMYGGTKQGLSLDDVKNYVVMVPPRNEQDRLVEWIEHATATLSARIRSAQRKVALLREYRTRLIADVVTGKRDVREAAARLPDEVEEPEPLDEIEANGDTEEAGVDDTDAVPEGAEA
ncbi:MAG: restriction endonuclease subunit S [Vicinamibacterales bacterium]